MLAHLEPHRGAGGLVGDHVARLELVEVHEVADVVGQEDGGAVDPGPDRPRVVPDGDVELLVVGALLDRRVEVEGGDGEDPRELARLDARHLTRGTVAPGGDLGDGGPFAGEQHGGRVVLVLLTGHGIAGGEDRAEEEHDTEQRDGGPAQVAGQPHRAVLVACGCRCPERDSAVPLRAVRSTGSRCICFSLQILRRSLCVVLLPEWRNTRASSALSRAVASPEGCRRAGPRDRRGNGGGPEGRARWRSAVRPVGVDRSGRLTAHPAGGWSG